MKNYIVEPCLVQSIKRGLRDVIHRARLYHEEFESNIDRKEFEEAATWIERYINQYYDKSLTDGVCKLDKNN